MPFNFFNDPKMMGLMGMAQGLLQAGGPSRMPVGLGGALGQGLGGALQSAMLGQQMQQRQRQIQLQEEEAQRKAMAPQGYGPGTQLFKPGEASPFHTVPFAPRPETHVGAQSDLGKLAADLQAGLITQPQFDEKYKKLTAPSQPMVTVDNRQESEFNKIVGREMGEQYAGLMKADMNAPATIGKYQRLGNLLGQVSTGKFKGATTDIKSAAKAMGIDLTALGVADDVAPAQAARALSNQVALELRNPQGGAGMPGALSERDLDFLIKSTPGLENDPAAIPVMIDYRIRLAKREQEVARKARAYRKKHGKFDEGFVDELQEWSNKNPLFPEAGKQILEVSPETQKLLDKYAPQ